MNIFYDKTFTRYCNHMDCKDCKYKKYLNNYCDDMDCEAMWQLDHDKQIRADERASVFDECISYFKEHANEVWQHISARDFICDSLERLKEQK